MPQNKFYLLRLVQKFTLVLGSVLLWTGGASQSAIAATTSAPPQLPFAELVWMTGPQTPHIEAGSAEGQQRLVLFWATWCPTCQSKLTKTLPQLQKEHPIEILTINMDEDEGRARHYVAKNKVSLAVYRDPQKKAQKALHVESSPHWAAFEFKQNKWSLLGTDSGFDADAINQAFGKPLLKP